MDRGNKIFQSRFIKLKTQTKLPFGFCASSCSRHKLHFFSRARQQLYLFPRLVTIACSTVLSTGFGFSALSNGGMFYRAWRRLQVFQR